MTIFTVDGRMTQTGPHHPFGWRWEYVDETTIQAVPVGLDGFGYAPVTNSSRNATAHWADTITVDLSTSGAGGMHPDYTLTASTGYEIIILIGIAADGSHGMTAVGYPAGTTVNTALLAAVVDDSWLFWSETAWLVRVNSNTEIIPFRQAGEHVCEYTDVVGNAELLLVSAGRLTTRTPINLTGFVPTNDTVAALIYTEATNSDNTDRSCYAAASTAATTWDTFARNRSSMAGRHRWAHARRWYAMAGVSVAAAIYYYWDTMPSNASDGLDAYVAGWELQ